MDSNPAPNPGLRFLTKAAAWALLLFGAVRIPWVQRHVLLPFAGAQGQIACRLVGTEPSSVFVGLSCTGADPMALVLASVLAFPAPWRERLKGCAIGLSLILALNTARIATLSMVVGSGEVFDALHKYVWPAVLIIAAAAYVFHWMRRTLEPGSRPRYGPSAAVTLSRTSTTRFLALLVLFVLAFYAISPWLMRSQTVLALARWATMAAAAVMAALGVSAEVTGNHLKTPYGSWVVTQSCVATPLLPVYLAAVTTLPSSKLWRVVAASAAVPLFLVLGSARLLVLAVPAALLGSHMTAVHAFYQILAAGILVAVAVWLSSPEVHLRSRAAGLVRALALGSGAALAAALAFRALLQTSVAASLHLGHGYDDGQGALALLPAVAIGVFAAIWAAFRVPVKSVRWLIGLAGVALGSLASVALVGELANHIGFDLPIAATRALPLALAAGTGWWCSSSRLESAPAPMVGEPLDT